MISSVITWWIINEFENSSSLHLNSVSSVFQTPRISISISEIGWNTLSCLWYITYYFCLVLFLVQFILQIEMSRTGLTKIVTLTPKYVIINNTEVHNIHSLFCLFVCLFVYVYLFSIDFILEVASLRSQLCLLTVILFWLTSLVILFFLRSLCLLSKIREKMLCGLLWSQERWVKY